MAFQSNSFPAVPMRKESALGIGFMIAGMFVFSGADTLAKLLTESMHPIQIAWSRMMGLLIGVVFIFIFRGTKVLHTSQPKLQLTRGLCAAISATLFIVGISFVPLADAIAVTFIAPFIVTILGAAILGESVGYKRWIAIMIGFAGTLLIIRPGFGNANPALLFVGLAAIAFAFRQVLSRSLSGADSTATTIAYTGIVAASLLTIPLPFFWQSPDSWREIYILIALAGASLLGELLVIKALELAEAVVVAPMQYSLIIWGTIYGYFVFNHLPDKWTVVGAIIIVATGIYTFHRENVRNRLDNTKT